LRFTLEAGEAVVVSSDVRRQHLDGHVAVEAAIACPIHLPHAAAANERDDVVGAEASAGSESHAACKGDALYRAKLIQPPNGMPARSRQTSVLFVK